MLIILLALLNGSSPSLLQDSNLQRELVGLPQRGLTYRFLDDETAEIKEEWSGYSRIKTLQEPGEAEIRAWADTHGVPILEINPALIDTSRYAGWYRYWTQVPLSNDIFAPLVVRDADGNGKPEVYGVFKDYTTDYFARVYELETTGVSTMRYQYAIGGGISIGFTDSDANGLLEYVLQRGDTAVFWEQPTISSLPTSRTFAHVMWRGGGGAIWTRAQFGFFDQDGAMDFLYRGSEPDSVSGFLNRTYVAEFQPPVTNFVRVWSTQLATINESQLGGYSVGDYDGDGRTEFVASELFGHVHVVKNSSDNRYAEVWRDSLPFVNVYYQTSGDVDNDGRIEFFVGATMSNGSWTTMFEADSNSHYSPKFIFHLLSGGTLDEPTYLTTDVDGDGRLELVICSGVDLYIFKSRIDNSYYLWYYKRVTTKQAVQFFDFNSDGKEDFIISKAIANGLGQVRFSADVYQATNIVYAPENKQPSSVDFFRSYPNPFNSSMTIQYSLIRPEQVSVLVFDITGKIVATFNEGSKDAGTHQFMWNASNLSSGVYVVRLQTNSLTITKKTVIVR